MRYFHYTAEGDPATPSVAPALPLITELPQSGRHDFYVNARQSSRNAPKPINIGGGGAMSVLVLWLFVWLRHRLVPGTG